MEELSKEYKLKIETELYQYVMLLIENEYNMEHIIDVNKKDSTKIIFKDKRLAIKKVAEAIQRFSKENNLDPNKVKDYLLYIIECRVDMDFIEEVEEVKEIILTDRSDEER